MSGQGPTGRGYTETITKTTTTTTSTLGSAGLRHSDLTQNQKSSLISDHIMGPQGSYLPRAQQAPSLYDNRLNASTAQHLNSSTAQHLNAFSILPGPSIRRLHYNKRGVHPCILCITRRESPHENRESLRVSNDNIPLQPITPAHKAGVPNSDLRNCAGRGKCTGAVHGRPYEQKSPRRVGARLGRPAGAGLLHREVCLQKAGDFEAGLRVDG